MPWKVKRNYSNNNIVYLYITIFLFISFISQKLYLRTQPSSFYQTVNIPTNIHNNTHNMPVAQNCTKLQQYSNSVCEVKRRLLLLSDGVSSSEAVSTVHLYFKHLFDI